MNTKFKAGDKVRSRASNRAGIIIYVNPNPLTSTMPAVTVCWNAHANGDLKDSYSVESYSESDAALILSLVEKPSRGRYMCVVPDSGREPKVMHCSEEEAFAEAERLAATHKLSCVRVVKVVATLDRKRITTYQNDWDK
jgi:hypothetical protein